MTDAVSNIQKYPEEEEFDVPTLDSTVRPIARAKSMDSQSKAGIRSCSEGVSLTTKSTTEKTSCGNPPSSRLRPSSSTGELKVIATLGSPSRQDRCKLLGVSLCAPSNEAARANAFAIHQDVQSGSLPTSRRPADPLAGSWSTQDQEAIPAAGFFGSLTLRKLSVFILCLATLIEFANQIHRLDDDYDASLSWEVIRPPLRHHNHIGGSNRPQLGLGSAAISSITEALSPILPFTGGVDLRRGDYWKSGLNACRTAVAQALEAAWGLFRVQDAYISPANSTCTAAGAGSVSSGRRVGQARAKTKHIPTLSSQKPFVSLDAIGDLTLGEVATIFEYAVESSMPGYNEGRFINGLAPRVKKVVVAMQDAVAMSRGKKTKAASVLPSPGHYGDIDALKFCAAMRIFGEWRVIRQVPDGYKGYAIGMSLGHKDIVQNVAKIEQGVHSWLDDHSENTIPPGETAVDLSPTLREILTYEIDAGINPENQLPRLRERSASMGLLWVRRQLEYQTRVFENALKTPKVFSSTVEAVSAAYRTVYNDYHGWAVQKIFTYSFNAAPEAELIYRWMNPHHLKKVMGVGARLMPSSDHVEGNSSPPSNPIEAIFQRVGEEWDKAIGRLFRDHEQADHTGTESDLITKQFDDYVTAEMKKDAHEHILKYLKIALPLLDDLAGLFEKLNMDDPTRV